MKSTITALVLVAAAGLAQVVQAASITLFNTGVDASSAVLPDSTIGDPHYSLLTVPLGSTTAIRIITSAGGFPIPPYIGDNSFSRWIGPNNDSDLNGPVGNYTYRTTFDLSGYVFGSASIIGGWSTDNAGVDILINGSSLGFTTSFTQFASGFSPFSVVSGFVAGTNTLDFVVNNGGGPTALRVEMSGSADLASTVPEPMSLALVAVALAGLALSRRKAC